MPPPSSSKNLWGSCVGRSGGRGLRDFHRRPGMMADGCYHWEGGAMFTDFFALKIGLQWMEMIQFWRKHMVNWVLFKHRLVHSKWWAVGIYFSIRWTWQLGEITGGRYFFFPKDVSLWLIVGLGWWFGILGVPLSNNPFHKGILRIQTTGPQINN